MSILCHASVRCRRYFQNRICIHEISASVCNTISNLKFLLDVKFSFVVWILYISPWNGTSPTVCKTSFIFHYETWKAGCIVVGDLKLRMQVPRTISDCKQVSHCSQRKTQGCPLSPCTSHVSHSTEILFPENVFVTMCRFGSSVLPADFLAVTYNGCVMKCVIKNET